jgi:hypothetical protein
MGGPPAGGGPGGGHGAWNNGAAERHRQGAAVGAASDLGPGDGGGGYTYRDYGGGYGAGPIDYTNQIAALAAMQAADAAAPCAQATIQSQLCAERAKQQSERWRIQHETQTQVFQTQQDVGVSRAQTQDRPYSSWDSYAR